MKLIGIVFCFVLMPTLLIAQQDVTSKIYAETTALSEKIVKGSPFSADAVSESVQALADGNRIVRSSTNKLYRNSEGRFRRELSGGSGGALGSFYSVGPGVTILDPVGGHRYLLDSELRTARVGSLPSVRVVTSGVGLDPQAPARVALTERMRAELAAAGQSIKPGTTVISPSANAEQAAMVATERAGAVMAERSLFGQLTSAKPKYDVRTEQMGVQIIEGVEAEGVRTVTTIPAGDIGNERPIEIIYEKWYSKDLQLIVMSRHSDPRFGEQTYRLTNIVRSEPDPSLFELPTGFKVVKSPAAAYTVSTGSGKGQSYVYTTAPTPLKPATPKSTRP